MKRNITHAFILTTPLKNSCKTNSLPIYKIQKLNSNRLIYFIYISFEYKEGKKKYPVTLLKNEKELFNIYMEMEQSGHIAF